MPWGPGTIFLGLVLAIGFVFVAVVGSQLATEASGHSAVPEDVGDIFDKAAETVAYGDQSLKAEALAEPTPARPQLLADLVASRIFYGAAGASTLLMVVPIAVATRLRPTRLWRLAGLNRFRHRWLWQPALWMLLAYTGVLVYSEVVRAAGLDVLIPDQPPPQAALRDPLTMAFFGFLAVAAAPVGEEALFRGLLFGGLTRWGFWPGALVSGVGFALSHVDPGTMIPFTAIGVLFAWLYWRSGSLWPAIVCHACFNATSFLILVLTA